MDTDEVLVKLLQSIRELAGEIRALNGEIFALNCSVSALIPEEDSEDGRN